MLRKEETANWRENRGTGKEDTLKKIDDDVKENEEKEDREERSCDIQCTESTSVMNC